MYAEYKVPKGGVGASCLCCDTLKLELELLLPSLFVFLWFALELKCPVDLCALLRVARYSICVCDDGCEAKVWRSDCVASL